MQKQLMRPIFVCLMIGALSAPVGAAEKTTPSPETPDAEQTTASQPNSETKGASTPTLKGKNQSERQRPADVFTPSEAISEDFAAPLPVDI